MGGRRRTRSAGDAQGAGASCVAATERYRLINTLHVVAPSIDDAAALGGNHAAGMKRPRRVSDTARGLGVPCRRVPRLVARRGADARVVAPLGIDDAFVGFRRAQDADAKRGRTATSTCSSVVAYRPAVPRGCLPRGVLPRYQRRRGGTCVGATAITSVASITADRRRPYFTRNHFRHDTCRRRARLVLSGDGWQ